MAYGYDSTPCGYEASRAFLDCSTKETRTSYFGDIFHSRIQYIKCPRYPYEQSLHDGESYSNLDHKGLSKLAIRLGCVACDCAGEPVRQYAAIPRPEKSTQIALIQRFDDVE